jgi:O-antigen/teichoic acid export membrane protein
LKEKILKIYKKVGIKSDRTKNIVNHVGLSFLFKGGSIIANFMLVPLTINYLDTTNYGIWLTLSSFIAWFSFFDIGLGNGLRNKFAEAKANGDNKLAKAYISSAYYTIGVVSLSLIVIFFILNIFIDWTKVFNTSLSLQKELGILVPIVFGFFCLQLVVKLITTIYTADQQHSIQGKIHFFTQVASLIVIWLMTKTNESSLLLFGTIFSILPVIILLTFNFIGFSTRYKNYKPSIALWKKKYLKEIFGLGVKFFVIQMSAIVLYSTDNLIITQLFSPADVVPYNISLKYFSISIMVFSIITTPFWSAITEAYTKKDFVWIRKSMNNLIKTSILFSILVLLMIFPAEWIYSIWVGKEIIVPMLLNVFMAVFVITTLLIQPFTFFINGTGKVNVQLVLGTLAAIVNIPLSIFFAKNLNMGTPGVILATIVTSIIGLFVYPIFYQTTIQKVEKR